MSSEEEPIKPFKLSITPKQRESVFELARASLVSLKSVHKANATPAAAGAQENYRDGLDSQTVENLCDYFVNRYDWRKHEAEFNNMGQHYTYQVNDVPGEEEPLVLHFIHTPSKREDAVPLVLAHGWPGSVFEFRDILPLLVDPPEGQQAYHVVCPSLIGYTFSDCTTKTVPGFTQMAHCTAKLMQRLGYQRYVAQGGDWGARLARMLAKNHEECVAIHLNYFHFIPSEMKLESDATEIERRGYERYASFLQLGRAYGFMQGTTPYTLGSVLATSPLALLTYIGEKFYRWTAPDAKDDGAKFHSQVITNVLLYYFSGSITSSFMFYFNGIGEGDVKEADECTIDKPVAFTCGMHEIGWAPEKRFKAQHSNVRFWEVAEEGGHFLAMEKPALLAAAMRKHFDQDDVKALLGGAK